MDKRWRVAMMIMKTDMHIKYDIDLLILIDNTYSPVVISTVYANLNLQDEAYSYVLSDK